MMLNPRNMPMPPRWIQSIALSSVRGQDAGPHEQGLYCWRDYHNPSCHRNHRAELRAPDRLQFAWQAMTIGVLGALIAVGNMVYIELLALT